MFCYDRTFTVETEHRRYPAVVTASALRQLNGNIEMISWNAVVYRHRRDIYEAALRKFEQSGLNEQGRIVVGSEDLLLEVLAGEAAVDATPRQVLFRSRSDETRGSSSS